MSDPNVKESQETKAIENETAKIPSVAWLGLALAAVAGSLVLKSQSKDRDALFVGQWVAPFMLFGIYNKIVKTQGND